MQHGRRHARFFGDGVQRGMGDPLTGEEVQGDVQKLFAAGGGPFPLVDDRDGAVQNYLYVLTCYRDPLILCIT